MQLILLVDAFLLDAVPAFLLGNAQGTGDVVSKIQPLLFRKVICYREEKYINTATMACK